MTYAELLARLFAAPVGNLVPSIWDVYGPFAKRFPGGVSYAVRNPASDYDDDAPNYLYYGIWQGPGAVVP